MDTEDQETGRRRSMTENITSEPASEILENENTLLTEIKAHRPDSELLEKENSILTGELDYCPVTSDLFPNKTLLELCKATWKNRIYTEKRQPYLRGCAWSPDGTCCLSVVNMDGTHLTELPRELYAGSVSTDRSVDPLPSTIHVKESGLIYDFCWYPGMNSSLPETCCWLTTSQHNPLQLWDAFDGGLRCSYRGYNAVDEMEPAISCTFSPDGSRIFAGYKKCVRTFHSDRPGRDFGQHTLQSPASTLACCGKLLAVGSWNTSLTLYSIADGGAMKSIGKMHGHSGGVTQAKFVRDGQRLVTGARKDDKLLVWDLRFYRRPLNILQRRVATNQRVYFDISPCGRYLVSGGTDGVLRIWDSMSFDWTSMNTELSSDAPTFQFQLHDDCCNSVSFHPFRPIIATGSGQYHSRDPIISLHDSCDDIYEQSKQCIDQLERTINESERTVEQSLRNIDQPGKSVNQSNISMDQSNRTIDQSDLSVSGEVKCENSLVFWWIGNVNAIDNLPT